MSPPRLTPPLAAQNLLGRFRPRAPPLTLPLCQVPLDDVVCAELGYPELAGEGDPLCTSQGEAICRYIDVMRTSMLVVPYLRKGPGLQCCAAPCFAGVNNAFTACSNFCIREAPCSVLVWRP